MAASLQWQIQRGQLNHNWLQNGVIIALNHASGICSGSVRPRQITQTLTEDISRWQERKAELANLLDRFENEMSPKIYFGIPPLSNCPKETRNWLEPLTHELWLQRGVREKIDIAKEAYKKTESAFQKLHAAFTALPSAPTADDLKPVCALLKLFIDSCMELSASISALPNRVICY